MSENDAGALEGALVPAPPPAQMRYEDENRDKVARVFVRVDYADGRIREYEATEPQSFQISDPEDVSTMSVRQTGLSIAAGGGFRGLRAAVPSLRLSFTAHPRHNMHIRTERTARPADGAAFACPRCGMISRNANDVREGYCGNCHDWTSRAIPAP
jgi:hypothetical protein